MKKKTQAVIAVILGNCIFGFSFLFSKLALMITIPSVLIAVRFTLAFFVLNLIVLIGTKIKKEDGNAWITFRLSNKPKKDILLLALFQPVIYFIAENYGIVYTSSAFAGIIIAVIPLAGIVFDVLLMHAKTDIRQILCALFSVIGVAITTIGARNMNSSVKGLLVLLIAVVAGALFYVFSKKAGEHYNPLERTYVMFGIGSAFYVFLAAVQCFGRYEELVLDALRQPVFWGSILYLAVVSSVVAFLLLNFGSSYVSVSQASLFANLTTVISTIAGVAILHETFNLQQGIGAVIILASVYVSSWKVND